MARQPLKYLRTKGANLIAYIRAGRAKGMPPMAVPAGTPVYPGAAQELERSLVIEYGQLKNILAWFDGSEWQEFHRLHSDTTKVEGRFNKVNKALYAGAGKFIADFKDLNDAEVKASKLMQEIETDLRNAINRARVAEVAGLDYMKTGGAPYLKEIKGALIICEKSAQDAATKIAQLISDVARLRSDFILLRSYGDNDPNLLDALGEVDTKFRLTTESLESNVEAVVRHFVTSLKLVNRIAGGLF